MSSGLSTLDSAPAAEPGRGPEVLAILGHYVRDVPVEPKTVRAMASVADACRDRKNTVIKGALLEGACSVESARTALTQAGKVGPVIPTAERDEVLGWFLQIDPALGPRA